MPSTLGIVSSHNNYIPPSPTPTPTVTPTFTPTVTPTPTFTPTNTVTPSFTPTPSPTRVAYLYYRWQITAVRTTGQNVQVSEFIFQNGGVDQSMSGVTATNPGGKNLLQYSEGPNSIKDGNTATKWLDYNFTSNGLSNVIFQFPSAKVFTGYRWATANNNSSMDPKNLTVAGSNDGVNWSILHSVTNFVSTTSRLTYNSPLVY